MAKPPSKLDQQRAMREARFTPAKKPTERHESAQPVKLDSPEATEDDFERSRTTRPQQLRDKQEAVKAGREIAEQVSEKFSEALTKSQERRLAAKGRERVQLNVTIPADLLKEVKIAAVEDEQRLESFVDMALREWLKARKA